MPLDIDPVTGAPIVTKSDEPLIKTDPFPFVIPSNEPSEPIAPMDLTIPVTDASVPPVQPVVTPNAPAVNVPVLPSPEPLTNVAQLQDRKLQKEELLVKMQEALVVHGMMESNIPHNHDYWDWKNFYRNL